MIEIPKLTQLAEPPPPAIDAIPTNAAIVAEWAGILQRALQSAPALATADVPKREPILGTWFRQGDLGFIYGPRGLGKTWLAMHLARKIAEGGRMASWDAPTARRVLYIDGEMPLDNLRERDSALSSTNTGGMFYLQHESLFHSSGTVLNLADPNIQAGVSELCRVQQVEVLFLDNLSCLFTGLKENDADGWERVLPWLLDLRRNRVAVVFVAHAGRNGSIRGTSRREDAAFWIIQLSAPDGTDDPSDGARFVSRFDKNRNATEEECPPIEWTFHRGPDNSRALVKWQPVSGLEKLKYWIATGLTSATDIAMELGVTKGRVSQMARVAMEQGWLRKVGQQYVLVSKPGTTNTASSEPGLEMEFGE